MGHPLLNSLTRLYPTMQMIVGSVLDTAGVPTLAQLSGWANDQAAVSIVDTGSGVYDIAVKTFRGDKNYLFGFATSRTISTMVSCTAKSFTANTDTANFTFKCEDDASTATDSSFDFILISL